MKLAVKKDMWVIDALVHERLSVSFSKDVTSEEAVELFMSGAYDDIIDSDIVDTEEAWITEEDLELDDETEED